MAGEIDDNTAAAACEGCGGTVQRVTTGRPARYCSPACRQRAYRARQAPKAARFVPAPAVPSAAATAPDSPAHRLAEQIAEAVRRAADAIATDADPTADLDDARTVLAELAALTESVVTPEAMPTPVVEPAAAPGVSRTARRDETPVTKQPLRRPPKGLLSEWLWRVLADLHAAGLAGLSIGRHMGAWPYLEERRGRGYVTAICPPDCQPSARDRRWLTYAGREHIATHADRYRELYPDVVLREPGAVALEELADVALWQALVDVATGTREPTPIPGYKHRTHRAALVLCERLHDRGLVADAPDRVYRLTEAGRAHYAAHWATYRTRYPDVDAPAPGDIPSAPSQTAGPAATPATPAPKRDETVVTEPRPAWGNPLKRRRWYNDDEIAAVQLVKTGDVDGSYWVIVAGDAFGTVRPRLSVTGGRGGWEARHRSGTTAWHTGKGKRPATRQAAVTDLLIDVHHAWREGSR